jgi:acetylornithine deacetylase
MHAPLTCEAILARLVSFDTTSRNSNLPLIAWVREYLDGSGVPYRVSLNPDGTKANLHAIIGPRGPGGLALAGHVDTVPVDGQAWQSDPFTLRRDCGRLYARGAADMKGFVACMLQAVPRLQAMPLTKPMHLFITYDEEISCDGARRLAADLAESGLAPGACIVGEPSMMQPVTGHKGKLDVRVSVRGLAAHSSRPASGVNAVFAAAEAIGWIAGEARRHAETGPFDDRFDPPYTTVHVGTVRGGAILNIVPETAEFAMEWRTVPAVDARAELARLQAHVAAAIEPAMRKIDPACGFSYVVTAWLPGLAELVCAVTGANAPRTVAYGAEAGIFQQEAGIPTLICGPGDIAQAHRPDEFVTEAQLEACGRFILTMAERLLA